MIEYYLQIRMVHISAVIASGLLFLLRAIGINGFAAFWPMHGWVRYLSYTVDTVLLTAALMLTTIIHQYPFLDAWLTVKVVMLMIYIALGSFGLKYGKTRRIRIVCSIAALTVYGYIITVARAHDPLGLFSAY